MGTCFQKEVACKCWFTSTGEGMPLAIKVRDEDGQIELIREIRVLSREKKSYGGVLTVEYSCILGMGKAARRGRLTFYAEECRWIWAE